MLRPILLSLWVMAAGIAGYAGLQAELTRPLPEHRCDEIFAAPLQLEPLTSNAPEPYTLTGQLSESRPEVVLSYQIIDQNGFGWILQRLPSEAPTEHRRRLPNVRNTHKVRVGVLATAEAERATIIDQAARSFNVAGWLEAQGWLAPKLALCQTFTLRND